MEKKVNHVSYYDQYSEILEVPVEYLKAVRWKVLVELEEINIVKGMKSFRVSEYDEIDKGKLKAVETLKARQDYLFKVEDGFFIAYLWHATMKTSWEAAEKFEDYFLSPILSKTTDNEESKERKLFDREEIDISALVDLAGTNLKNIKAYNSKILAVLEAEDLNEVTLQEISNHYLRFYRGIWSLDMKINILRFHLIHRQHDLKALVDKFAASVEGELQQYEEELKTTRFKVFQLVKKKTNMFGLRWLPDSWKGAFVIAGMNIFFFLGKKLMHWAKISYSKRHISWSNEKN